MYVGLRCVTGNCVVGAAPDFGNDYSRRFASTVDPLNIQNIWTTGTPGGAPGDPFGKEMVIIITSDRGSERRIRQAAREAGYSDLIINTGVLPVEFATLGLDYGKDEMGMVHRLTEWDDTYMNTPPLRAFRVAIVSSVVDPFPIPPLSSRGGKNISEKVSIGGAVAELRMAILTKYDGYTATEYTTDRRVPEVRFICVYPTWQAESLQIRGILFPSATARMISLLCTAGITQKRVLPPTVLSPPIDTPCSTAVAVSVWTGSRA